MYDDNPTTVQGECEKIYLRRKDDENLQAIADEIGISYECARKWWRRGNREGLPGLMLRKRGRPTQGLLSQFAREIRETSLRLKRKHKRWGAAQILLEMQKMESLATLKLPSRSHLYPYFREHCPECLNIWTKHKEVPRPARATAVHEVWQVDR